MNKNLVKVSIIFIPCLWLVFTFTSARCINNEQGKKIVVPFSHLSMCWLIRPEIKAVKGADASQTNSIAVVQQQMISGSKLPGKNHSGKQKADTDTKTASKTLVQTRKATAHAQPTMIHPEKTADTLAKKMPTNEIQAVSQQMPVGHSEEVNGKWNIAIGTDKLRVNPGKWSHLIVIYPMSTPRKDNLRLLQPDFPGVVYQSAVNGDLTVDKQESKVVIEKYTATENNAKMPFFLSLKYSPAFLIFGDPNNMQNWFVYQHGGLSAYMPAANLDTLFTMRTN